MTNILKDEGIFDTGYQTFAGSASFQDLLTLNVGTGKETLLLTCEMKSVAITDINLVQSTAGGKSVVFADATDLATASYKVPGFWPAIATAVALTNSAFQIEIHLGGASQIIFRGKVASTTQLRFTGRVI